MTGLQPGFIGGSDGVTEEFVVPPSRLVTHGGGELSSLSLGCSDTSLAS